MVDVSILIVCYKSLPFIDKCLEGVFEHTSGPTFEVLITDCSGDGTAEFVRAQYPRAIVIDNSENLGFGKGNNFLATHAKGEFLVLLNPDVIVVDNAIGELYATALTLPKAGAIGGRARLPNGTRDPGSRQSIPTLARLAFAAIGGAKFMNGALPENATEAREVETLSGAFMLVRADAWRAAEGFDVSFFMYSEELDLCQRLRKLGWAIVMTPKAEIIHLVGGGQGQSPRRIELLTTSRMHFFYKHWSWGQATLGGVILWTHGLIRLIAATIGSIVIKRQRAKELRQAYFGIVFHPQKWWNGFHQGAPD